MNLSDEIQQIREDFERIGNHKIAAAARKVLLVQLGVLRNQAMAFERASNFKLQSAIRYGSLLLLQSIILGLREVELTLGSAKTRS
jgi:hypothetical protein